MVKRIVVGAHYGLKDWLAQRITAAVMAVYTLLLATRLLLGPTLDREVWRGLMSGTIMRFLTFLFIVCLCYHAWVGVRDIWMDYVKPTALRLTLHALTLLGLVGCAGWATRILWSI
ncbi:MAG: succinate dehydrogenase, hydrophobic membrane anchor protein [Betaproteobacteria bacterium]|nr:succinate dehydrogenase, hydrophobic membrane anchor protein [Betaproteobacteria bacterium]